MTRENGADWVVTAEMVSFGRIWALLMVERAKKLRITDSIVRL
jgi:hypothetical protein